MIYRSEVCRCLRLTFLCRGLQYSTGNRAEDSLLLDIDESRLLVITGSVVVMRLLFSGLERGVLVADPEVVLLAELEVLVDVPRRRRILRRRHD